ncbi:MAG: hypothetical protein OQK12_05990 [Motiliproteus sp.]|nr:hypothetical protein [Motiliproteus sp.]MCW9054026.1 hypothetical protein [Motiliproteus sp.]
MQEMLSRKQVLTLSVATMVGFSLFAFLAPMESLGLSAARRPEIWALSRYGIAAGWLLIAAIIYATRGFKAYGKSLNYAAYSSGIVAMALATFWVSISGGYAIYGSALCYTAISALLCLTIPSFRWAMVAGPVILVIQIAADWFLLFIAGQFRIN